MKYQQTLNLIHSRLKRLGDLPVFSATVNQIRQISESRDSDAMSLAMAIMKDASLSAKVIKLANSSQYNRGQGPIKLVSRAVVLLGFERIRNLSMTLKLIETFHESTPGVDMRGLLMRSFLNAAFVRELAAESGRGDIEETYICGLLYDLGELIVAYTLPEEYQKLLHERAHSDTRWSTLELQILGGGLSDIGQDMAQSWGFPNNVVLSMDELTAERQPASVQRNYQLASRGSQLLGMIYNRGAADHSSFTAQIERLQDVAGLEGEQVEQALNNAFRLVCRLVQDYGLPAKPLAPPLIPTDDQPLEQFRHRTAYYIHSRDQLQASESEVQAAPVQEHKVDSGTSERVLAFTHELTEMITHSAPLQDVLNVVVRAIEECTGFQRVLFCLLEPGGKALVPKIARGSQLKPLREYFNLDAADGPLFFRVIEKRMTLLINDLDDAGWRERLPQAFIDTLNPQGLMLVPLATAERAIGVFYADRLAGQGPVSDEDFRLFNQFQVQARLALLNATQHKHKRR